VAFGSSWQGREDIGEDTGEDNNTGEDDTGEDDTGAGLGVGELGPDTGVGGGGLLLPSQ